jgi:glucan-binding YG repeat protein
MVLIIGVVSIFWVWSGKTLSLWHYFICNCGCRKSPLDSNVNKSNNNSIESETDLPQKDSIIYFQTDDDELNNNSRNLFSKYTTSSSTRITSDSRQSQQALVPSQSPSNVDLVYIDNFNDEMKKVGIKPSESQIYYHNIQALNKNNHYHYDINFDKYSHI